MPRLEKKSPYPKGTGKVARLPKKEGSVRSQTHGSLLRVKKVCEINALVSGKLNDVPATSQQQAGGATNRHGPNVEEQAEIATRRSQRSKPVSRTSATKISAGETSTLAEDGTSRKRAAKRVASDVPGVHDAKRRKTVDFAKAAAATTAPTPKGKPTKATSTASRKSVTNNSKLEPTQPMKDTVDIGTLQQIIVKQTQRILALEEEVEILKTTKGKRKTYSIATKELAASYVIKNGLHLREAGQKSGVNKEVIRQTVLAKDPTFFSRRKI